MHFTGRNEIPRARRTCDLSHPSPVPKIVPHEHSSFFDRNTVSKQFHHMVQALYYLNEGVFISTAGAKNSAWCSKGWSDARAGALRPQREIAPVRGCFMVRTHLIKLSHSLALSPMIRELSPDTLSWVSRHFDLQPRVYKRLCQTS